MGRESQIRIEPWANPAKVTYVVPSGPPFQPLLPRGDPPRLTLPRPDPATPRLGLGNRHGGGELGLEVGTRVTDSTPAPIGGAEPSAGGDGGERLGYQRWALFAG